MTARGLPNPGPRLLGWSPVQTFWSGTSPWTVALPYYRNEPTANSLAVLAFRGQINGSHATMPKGLGRRWVAAGSVNSTGSWQPFLDLFVGYPGPVQSAQRTLALSPTSLAEWMYCELLFDRPALLHKVSTGYDDGTPHTNGPISYTRASVAVGLVGYAEGIDPMQPPSTWAAVRWDHAQNASFDHWWLGIRPLSPGESVSLTVADSTYGAASIIALLG